MLQRVAVCCRVLTSYANLREPIVQCLKVKLASGLKDTSLYDAMVHMCVYVCVCTCVCVCVYVCMR